jgi:hypothetical protein
MRLAVVAFLAIALELLVPETAKNQSRRIIDEIKSLDEMPMRYSLYKDEPWTSKEVRFIPVNNYVVLYLPDCGFSQLLSWNKMQTSSIIIHVF